MPHPRPHATRGDAPLGRSASARWAKQTEFLREWDVRLEPIIVSGRYQGKELLYREQIEAITELMLTRSGTTHATRPLNWFEFCESYKNVLAFTEITKLLRDKLAFIFDETKSLPPRRAMQCRLAILGLYLIRLSKLAGFETWAREEEPFWDFAKRWYDWQISEG
jgi:hypothetical protein